VLHTTGSSRQVQHGRGEDVGVFVGKYERQLDPKGRLALPSDFRPRFEPRCYLAYGQDGCIEVMTPEAFEDMANELMDRQKRGEITLAELRAKASNAFVASVDGQGRITIDRELRTFAGIEPGSPVMVSGAFDRVEVWHPETFESINSEGGRALKGRS
jgi:MraZ protein